MLAEFSAMISELRTTLGELLDEMYDYFGVERPDLTPPRQLH